MGKRTAEAQRMYRQRRAAERDALKALAEQTVEQRLLPLTADQVEAERELQRPEASPWYGKRGAKWRDAVIRRYGNPVEIEARLMDPRRRAQVAAELKCSLVQAEEIQHRARLVVAGYVLPKVPQELVHDVAEDGGLAERMRRAIERTLNGVAETLELAPPADATDGADAA